MKKLYIFVYNPKMGEREEVIRILENIEDILNWRYDLPNCFYIISEKNADDLATLILNKYDDRTSIRFIISEMVLDNRQGWMPSESWDFINKLREESMTP